MNDDLQAYVRSPGPVPDGDYTTLEHRALSEVLQLSPEVLQPLETQIESDYQVAKTQAKETFERDQARIERDFHAENEEVRSRYEAQIEDIRADYEDQLSTLKVETQHKRKKVNQKAAELERQAEKEHQDQVMVADFVAEGAVTKAKQKRLEAQATVETARRYLDELGVRADRLLHLYRQPTSVADGQQVADDTAYENPTAACRAQQAAAEKHLGTLQRLWTAQLFVGARPVLLAGGILIATTTVLACLYLLNVDGLPPVSVTLPVTAGAVILVAGIGGWFLWQRAKRQAQRTAAAFHEALRAARAALEQHHHKTQKDIEQEFQASQKGKEAELQKARSTFKQTRDDVARQRTTSLREIEQQRRETLDRLKQKRDEALEKAERAYRERTSALEHRREQDLARIQERCDQETAACEKQYQTSRRQLEKRWDEAAACLRALLQRTAGFDERIVKDLGQLLGDSWTPPTTLLDAVRFGTFELDWQRVAETVRSRAKAVLDMAEPARVPALLEFPDRCAILLQSEREGRQRAIETLRAVMMRLFTSLPPGEVRFTILDPVGLGESFAGFMHAGDYQEALIGGRIWTETTQIQQQLEDLTGHMENVIQKYLRNEFETLEEYNQQAGELAEPYRFLVVADFPTNFSEESARRLSSIVHSGSRCGVYTLIEYDTRRDMPQGVDINDIMANSIHLVYEDGRYVWQDDVFRQFPLALDEPPAEATLTRIMHVVGKAGAESARVEVPFSAVAPADGQYWSLDSREELRIPLGRTGATRLQYFRLGRGVAQHMLIAGKTGSGKSTLLHVMVTNLALWYAPDQVQVYLIDFKQGVEFKTYVTHDLPHARAVAIESDREFGLSILRRLDAEMTQRGELFRQKGVQDIAAYRESTGKPMPRTVLIVDEFQIFFAEDDKLAQDASVLLEKLVRQGRAFGIHVVLGSQTLGGVFGLARSTIGQMAVRIALQCSEADSQLILDDDNVAARLLSRPGEAIYNDVGGSVAGNSPFQTAWLPESTRDSYLSRVGQMQRDRQVPREDLIVFEGSAPADVTENRELAAALEHDARAEPVSTPKIWLGAPVTIKEPTSITLQRQSGANVLMVGQRDDVAMNLMTAAVVSLAAQLRPASARFVILDGSPPDSPQAGVLPRVTEAVPNTCQLVVWRDVPDVLAELSQEVEKRTEADSRDNETIIVLIYGLQRYRALRRSEDAFGFSLDEEVKARPDAQFADLLREGPSVGIHVVAWADTLSTLERTLDRQTMREFDHRVLFQMSAADSSNLIDSPVANQLGLHRVLLYSEEQGGIEKFRPYAPLKKDWLDRVAETLAQKTTAGDT